MTQDSRLTLHLLREPQIVGVEKGDPIPRRSFDARIAGRAHAGVGLTDHPDPVTERCEHRGRVIARSVVDDDHLVRMQRLRQRGFDRLSHTMGAVIGGNDD